MEFGKFRERRELTETNEIEQKFIYPISIGWNVLMKVCQKGPHCPCGLARGDDSNDTTAAVSAFLFSSK